MLHVVLEFIRDEDAAIAVRNVYQIRGRPEPSDPRCMDTAALRSCYTPWIQ